MNLFDMGGLTMTCGVRDLMDRHGVEYTDKMLDCVRRHLSGDWGSAPATGHKHCQMWHWITTEIQLPICLT